MKGTHGSPSLTNIQLVSWAVLGVMIAGSWSLFDFSMVRSVFLGGLIANSSFWLLQRDLIKILQPPFDAVKSRFFIKYYLRLTVLALVLFVLISRELVNILGLLAGLSTVIVSVTALAVALLRKTPKTREAS